MNYTWSVRFTTKAEKQFKSLGSDVQKRILKFLNERVRAHPNPQTLAEALYGEFSGLYRFRVGDYRLICSFENNAWLITVITLGHRREVYS